MKKCCILIFLSLCCISSFNYAQQDLAKNTNTKSLHDVAFNHRQIYNSSCIPMSIEMVLKFNKRIPSDDYRLQTNWKEKTDGTFGNFDGKIISGLKFKHQFNIKRGDGFPFERLFKTIDAELAAGRKVIISLPSGFNFWHMYVIDKKVDKDYLAYSRFNNDKNLVIKKDIKSWIFGCKGTDILTYQVAAGK
ncbi:hypothetical protein FA048_15970 [Pedobacter polaris]|uniref:Peptidase C39-like domain-containing protein n=1 Tax=Pedobacter polaris TaxID=2571273 RepID=A0A4U1CIH2_9SPHI|nr:hypothetical protein [Pedobacter polaris]TKC06698.1 hypothetical protein FA048_15970 [Pedobacter polaris]